MGDLDDPAAFRALFEAHFCEVHRYLAHRLGDAGAAEDLAAGTFLRGYRARGRFRSGNARAWLFTIATNLLRDEARGRGAREAALALVPGERAAAVAALLALLPDRVETPVTPPPALAACFVRSGAPQPCLHALADIAAAQRAAGSGRVFYERNEFTLTIKYIGADGRSEPDPGAAGLRDRPHGPRGAVARARRHGALRVRPPGPRQAGRGR
jgi:DNA-directed RNA polymerase specialized sigma24 family protein